MTDIRLSDETRANVARNPHAADTLAADLATRLAPLLLAACTATAANPRTQRAGQPGQPLSPVGVAERLLRAKREGLRLAEWQLREAQRAEAVE